MVVMQAGLIKVLIKILDENKDKLLWEHLCYAPKDLYLKFINQMGIERFEMADFVSKWAKEDFNIDLPMTTAKDISILKELIFDNYKITYPQLIRQSHTDHQGWVRIWVSSRMERELQRK